MEQEATQNAVEDVKSLTKKSLIDGATHYSNSLQEKKKTIIGCFFTGIFFAITTNLTLVIALNLPSVSIIYFIADLIFIWFTFHLMKSMVREFKSKKPFLEEEVEKEETQGGVDDGKI